MFDDLDAWFYDNAVAAYTEYVGTKNSGVFGQSKDLRTAVNAAAVLYHLRGNIPESHRQSRSWRRKLLFTCSTALIEIFPMCSPTS